MSNLEIYFLNKAESNSEYDWANLNVDDIRVGKSRCLIKPELFIIYSIIIFPEYEGNGYGKLFVEQCKSKYKVIIADKVRFTAIGFWERMGFTDNLDGNWIYKKEK